MMSIPEGSGSPHTVFTLPEGTDDIDGASVSADGKKFVFSGGRIEVGCVDRGQFRSGLPKVALHCMIGQCECPLGWPPTAAELALARPHRRDHCHEVW